MIKILSNQFMKEEIKTTDEKFPVEVPYLFVKSGYSTVKVSFNEIKYIEGLKDYIKIFISEKSLITKSTIKNLERKLPAELFARVHKSYIISIDKIEKIEYNHIFIGEKKIPIGLQFKDSFYRKIDFYRL